MVGLLYANDATSMLMVWTSPQHGSREENEENGTRTLENMRRVEIDGRRDGSRCRAHQVLPPILLSTTGFCGVRVWALGGLDMRVRGKEVGGRQDGLKHHWVQARAGSSPAAGTPQTRTGCLRYGKFELK